MKVPLRHRTPIEMLAPGVDPSLNREPPSAVDVRRMMFLFAVFGLVICGLVTFILWQVSAGASNAEAAQVLEEVTEEPTLVQYIEVTSVPTSTLPPTETPLPTETIIPTFDSWALTGTALFFATSTATPTWTPTLDYCWWQTPSPTPSVTPNQPTPTLDDWSLQGTQVFIEAHTLTPTAPPTQRPPRALCDMAVSPTPARTQDDTIPIYDGRFPTLEPIAPPATWTPVPPPAEPVFQVPVQQPEIQQVVITAPPQVIYVTTAPQNPVVIVITATNIPATATNTPTHTATHTETPTPTATFTATNTETPTFTPSPTLTPSLTPTDVPTNTLVPTEVPTSTLPPTAYPQLQIVGGNCDGGHLTFTIQNFGGDLLEPLQFRLIDQFLLVNSTGLFGGIPAGGSVMVDLGSPASGLWILGFDYLSQTVYSNQVTCSAPPTEEGV